MAERRAVFVTIPPLLSGIIAEIVCREARLQLIAQLDDAAVLTERLPALAPDIVVIGLRTGENDEIGSIALQLVPGAKILVVSHDGRRAYLHEMRPHRTELCDFSPATLLAALEEAEPPAKGWHRDHP